MFDAPISFSCPACGIRLTVPAMLAGVSGPCPTCRSPIQAPFTIPALISSLPVVRPLAQLPVPSPGDEIRILPVPLASPAKPDHSAGAASPAFLRPEPRQLPSRLNFSEPVAKQMPEAHPSDSPVAKPYAGHRRGHGRNRMIRAMVPLVFIAAALTVGAAVVTVLKNRGGERNGAANLSPGTMMILPPISPRSLASGILPRQAAIPTLPVSLPSQRELRQPIPRLPDGMSAIPPSSRAMEVLNRFLSAKTLAERLPLIESHTAEADLAKTCLAGPLPEARDISIDVVENNPMEQVADFYHILNFEAGSGRKNPQTILVRIRGSAEPKVVVDPFLDSYGGRLAAYATTPNEIGGTFQVIIWPLASCYDEKVPDRDKKLTLKLLPQDNAKEMAMAYFSKQSKIAEMLEDGTYSLKYGNAKACTVMLRWNTEENPQMPYLEAIALKSLNWNP